MRKKDNQKDAAAQHPARPLVWSATRQQQTQGSASRATSGLVHNEEEYLSNLFNLSAQVTHSTAAAPTTPTKTTADVVVTDQITGYVVPPINPRVRLNHERRTLHPRTARVLDFGDEEETGDADVDVQMDEHNRARRHRLE